MTATFVVEDGTGLSTANSYLSVADADQYHDNFGAPAAWTDLTTAEKERHLREATRYLDQMYSAQWIGVRKEELQALDWPRAYAEDADGWLRDADALPRELKDATALMALKSVQTSPLIADVAAGTGDATMTSKRLDVLSITRQYSGTLDPQKRFVDVDKLVAPIVTNSATVVRA